MALASELVATVIILATKPFSLLKLTCIFGVRTGFIILHTWLELTTAAISLHVSLFWKLILWTFALACLPFRILAALQRERQLEVNLLSLQIELENFIREKEQVEEHHHRAVRELKMMEFMLTELEEDYEKTLARLELLEDELRKLKVENLHLKEIREKDFWNLKGRQEARNDQNRGGRNDYFSISYGKSPSRFNSNECEALLQDILMQKDAVTSNGQSLGQPLDLSRRSDITLPKPEISGALGQQREVALIRSLFSAILSLFVGITIWEGKEPCMPLVTALFTVVSISLVSVSQFISTVANRPASDAVALLSLNCFILGTISYPALPRVTQTLASLAISSIDHMIRWLGGSTPS